MSLFAKLALGAAGKVGGRLKTLTTGLRPRPTVVSPGVVGSAAPKPGIINQLTRPRTFTRPPVLEPTKRLNLPVLNIADDLAAGAKTSTQALDELANLAKSRLPKPEVKPIADLVKGAKAGAITADEAIQQAIPRLSKVTDEVDDLAALARNKVTEDNLALTAARNKQLGKLAFAGSTAAGSAPFIYEAFSENEAPVGLKLLGAAATALPGARALGKGVSNILSGQKGTMQSILGTLGIGFGLRQAADLDGGVGTEAGALTPEQDSEILLQPPAADASGVDPLQAMIDNINAQAEAQLDAIDASVGQALEQLIAAYGGDAAFNAALAANDQMLAMELAAIDAEAAAAKSQIGANYDAAIAQIGQYTTQASQALSDAAAQQQAAYEVASGGLETAQVPAGMGSAEASAAGLSGTAVGGAGVTGAALARTQAAGASSQAAADKAAVITTLSDQAATGRLDEASMLAALDAGIIDAKSAARIDSANNKSKIRQANEERKIQIAGLKYESTVKAAEAKAKVEADRLANQLALKQLYAQLTPEQRAAYAGGSAAQRKTPSWLVEKGGSGDTNVGSKKIPVTLRERNQIVNALAGYAQSEEAYGPTALSYWSAVLQNLLKVDAALIQKLEALGIPSTASQLARSFSTTK